MEHFDIQAKLERELNKDVSTAIVSLTQFSYGVEIAQMKTVIILQTSTIKKGFVELAKKKSAMINNENT